MPYGPRSYICRAEHTKQIVRKVTTLRHLKNRPKNRKNYCRRSSARGNSGDTEQEGNVKRQEGLEVAGSLDSEKV